MPLSTLGTALTWTGIAGCLLFGGYSLIMIVASMGGARLLSDVWKRAATLNSGERSCDGQRPVSEQEPIARSHGEAL